MNDSHIQNAERPSSKDVNTHHHYGAQQVRTPKVDPIFLRIILFVSFLFLFFFFFFFLAKMRSVSNLNVVFLLLRNLGRRLMAYYLIKTPLISSFFLSALAGHGRNNPRFRLVRHHRMGMDALRAVSVARWLERALLENASKSQRQQPVVTRKH